MKQKVRIAGVVFLASLVLGGCGHTLGTADGAVPAFDLRQPHCTPKESPPRTLDEDSVLVRYLGAGGIYLEWRGEAIMAGPFFSNPGLLRVGLGRVRHDPGAMCQGLSGIDPGKVGALVFGHSHYDHLGDLPWLAPRLQRARAYVNQAGMNALAPYIDGAERRGTGLLTGRLTLLKKSSERPVRLRDAHGDPLPFLLTAIPADHAPHFLRVLLMEGDGKKLDQPWENHRYWALHDGDSFAFVLDLTDGTEEGASVRFRVLYQDSAGSQVLHGLEEMKAREESILPFDLAVGCMASAHLVKDYPEKVMQATAPRHLLVTHYDNFFKPWGHRRHFVPLLTRGRANRFLREAAHGMRAGGAQPRPPDGEVCGASTATWTLPLVGEWMVFRAAPAPADPAPTAQYLETFPPRGKP